MQAQQTALVMHVGMAATDEQLCVVHMPCLCSLTETGLLSAATFPCN